MYYQNYYNRPGGSGMNRIKDFFTGGSLLSRLILINVAVWGLMQVLRVIGFLFSSPSQGMSGGDEMLLNLVVSWLSVPASFDILLTRPWTLITYMFLQVGFFHLLFNMLFLFWFGRIFMEYLNERQLLSTYILGGIAGALLYMIAFNVFPVFSDQIGNSIALGASASVLAVVVAIAVYVPNYTIYLLFLGPVKIKYIAIGTVVLDFFLINSGNAGGHIAHLGGAIYGFLYIRSIKQGSDISHIFEHLTWAKMKAPFKKKSNFRTTYFKPHKERPISDEEYNKRKVKDQKKIDKILEKIAKYGYESLTREEKEMLFKMSGNDKDKER
ncbi:MAG: rhomboid family intramembrane serine protease [Bacteroidales bacterium]|nr:rhomboid family intramembrane serine protease [Bacteroidales bacterium]